MKQKKLLSIILVVALAFLLGIPAMAVNSDGEERIYTITDPYVYDVIPGTEAWNDMTSAERYEACYVSADVAENMTTQALVETVLGYPFWVNVYAFDTLEKGIDVVSSYFPPLAELLKREDAANALAEYSASQSIHMRSGEINLKAYGVESLQIAIGKDSETMTALEPRVSVETVKTPNGTSVEVYDGFTWSDISASFGQYINYDIAVAQSESMLNVYPNASIVRNPSPKYNVASPFLAYSEIRDEVPFPRKSPYFRLC